jgi:succinyl-diaminopimelate desuccinylase
MAKPNDGIVALTSRLIERRSVSPDDAGCQALLGEVLASQGFELEHLRFGAVDNLWATHGSGEPMLVLAGHTDVVPSGPEAAWTHDPFQPTRVGNLLYGRGSADMKGSLAAMISATAAFLGLRPDHRGTLAYLITSDEEDLAVDGTTRVVDWLAARNVRPAYCIVGEPSSTASVGDTIRIGRRGSLNGRLTVAGTQGHVAFADRAVNPIHRGLPVLDRLAGTRWDDGNAQFPPTSFQISNIHAGTGANNVIPGTMEVVFNFRYSTEQTADGLKRRTEELLADSGVDYELEWSLSGEPFLTATDTLIDAVAESVRAVTGAAPELSTGGGTSDGRFIARLGTEIVELGPVNATIHSVDECTDVGELGLLAEMYLGALMRLLPGADD